MKLDLKKTAKVGFAFAIICLFWQVYDFVVPLLIEDAFGLSNFWRGVVMGLDNLLSLFMLPLFGKLSDKSKSPKGRRTPFIVWGTIAAVVCMVFIPISANKQLKEANELRDYWSTRFSDDAVFRQEQLASWYDAAENGDFTYISKVDYKIISNPENEQYLTKAEYRNLKYTEIDSEKDGFLGFFGETHYYLGDIEDGVELTKAEYDEIYEVNQSYNKFVATGVDVYLSEYVHELTQEHIGRLVIYLIILLFVLLAMGTYRSPAVALMPDVTPKPLRSQANAIINLAGGIGGAIAFLIYTIVLGINPTAYILVYSLAAGFMLLLLFVFTRLVDEPAFVEDKIRVCEEYGFVEDETELDDELKKEHPEEDLSHLSADEIVKLEKAKKVSFLLILASIFMWFMGYNAVSTNLSIYSTKALSLSPGTAGLISGISMGISAIAFIPVGYLAVKIGRRKSIMIGFALAVVSYALIWLFLTPGDFASVFFTLFYLIAGFGLIIANVNTFPMVVELSKAEDVGKYTGYYYMATMSAQAITPAVAGLFMDAINLKALFAYSVVCIIISIVLMGFVKHGDSKPLPKEKRSKGAPAVEAFASAPVGEVVSDEMAINESVIENMTERAEDVEKTDDSSES